MSSSTATPLAKNVLSDLKIRTKMFLIVFVTFLLMCMMIAICTKHIADMGAEIIKTRNIDLALMDILNKISFDSLEEACIKGEI